MKRNYVFGAILLLENSNSLLMDKRHVCMKQEASWS